MNTSTKQYTDGQKASKARYIAEKTDYVAAHLPLGYKDKVNKIAEKAGTCKAQAIKEAIDALYATMFDEQPTEQE